ncbi:MAG: hypothetical protein Q8R28_04770 [Dehalococcoidia bacterium]|nr:hypothetical protein [Dehalococcoidia bacterium]
MQQHRISASARNPAAGGAQPRSSNHSGGKPTVPVSRSGGADREGHFGSDRPSACHTPFDFHTSGPDLDGQPGPPANAGCDARSTRYQGVP